MADTNQGIDIDTTWNLLCNKIHIHNKSLSKHKEFVKEYMQMSNTRLDMDKKKEFLINKNYSTNHKNENETNTLVSIHELESRISQLKEIQEKLYGEIKDHVRDCYQHTNYDYHDLEKLFRSHKLGIYLIADKINRDKLIPGTDLLNKDNEPVEYKVDFIVTDSNAYYLEQLGIECTEENITDSINRDIIIEAVQENLTNLLECGDVMVVDEEETQNALSNMVIQGNDINDMNSY